MGRAVRRIGLVLLLLALLGCLTAGAAETEGETLTILFTHDTHDHFYTDGDGLGGYVRLATLLKRECAAAEGAVVTVDGGDFSMGSLFQTVYTTDAPELQALGAMGYDVATLGNHEFDYRDRGLAEMLETAAAVKASGKYLPAVVQANYRVPVDPAAGERGTAAMENYPVTDYVILERQGMRIAVFGLLGLDAHECAPMSGMTFEPVADAARRVLADIQAAGGADVVLCLSHTGTEDGRGEDYDLAKAVDGIDVIVSGHTHTTLEEPISVNGTLIVSAGEYAQYLGRLVVRRNSQGGVDLVDYDLLPVGDTIPVDGELADMATRFQAEVESGYLADYGLRYHQQLTTAERDFTIQETGDLIGDAYIAAVRAVEGPDYVPVDFAVVPNGVIRGSIQGGPVTTAQAFDILSLGSGADGSPAYPLVSVYLTGEDLLNAFEVDASIATTLMPAAALYGAGMHWVYNPHRMILDRVTYAVQLLEDGGAAPIQPDKLYRVVADLYSGQMLGAVEGQSFGLLTVTPRDENGQPVTDLESRIIRKKDGTEMKAWFALAAYLTSQEVAVPQEGCKTVSPSWSPFALLADPGLPTLVALGAVLVLAALLWAVIWAVWRRRRR